MCILEAETWVRILLAPLSKVIIKRGVRKSGFSDYIWDVEGVSSNLTTPTEYKTTCRGVRFISLALDARVRWFESSHVDKKRYYEPHGVGTGLSRQ